MLAVVAFCDGWGYLTRGGSVSVEFLACGLLWGVIGLALILGLHTRVFSLAFGIWILFESIWQWHIADSEHSRQLLLILLPASVALAIALLGPGAASLDARRFGRREIVIAPIHGKP